uniref:Uncharacterized protein n=1 Tax=Candidatus Kentrum sp. LFY TaxID=2126342 RepID=A0A450XB21_9GAMM|nr:MAG: hypothetical protein BECKLFY1418C_GA0070996_13541 [Candidatus Kentron sp. LFY]
MGVWCRIMACALMFMPRIYITTEQKCRFGSAMGLYSRNGDSLIVMSHYLTEGVRYLAEEVNV